MATQLESNKAIADHVRNEHARLKQHLLEQLPVLAHGARKNKVEISTALIIEIAQYEFLDAIVQGPGGFNISGTDEEPR